MPDTQPLAPPRPAAPDDEAALAEAAARCADEPIRTPGSIQPHGHLLGVRVDHDDDGPVAALPVLVASRGASAALGPQAAPGGDLASLSPALADLARSVARGEDDLAVTADPVEVPAGSGRTHHATAHSSGELVLVELEPAEGDEGLRRPWHLLLPPVLRRLQDAGTVAALADGLATGVRRLTGFDRVMVYRFDEEWNGEVLAEDRRDDLPPFLGLRYPDSDIPAQARALYARQWLRIIPTSTYQPRALEGVTGSGAADVDLSLATLRSVSPVHLQYLRTMGVVASMSISLLDDDRLWGLIACHHYAAPHRPSVPVRTAAEFLGRTASLLLPTVLGREADRHVVAAAQVRARLTELVAERPDLPLEALTRAEVTLADLVPCGGAALRLHGELRLLGTTPPAEEVAALADLLVAGPLVTSALGTHAPSLGHLSDVASGVLAAAVSGGQPGDLVAWFRPEVLQQVTWGGDPRSAKVVHDDDGHLRLSPRHSFAAWSETVRGTAVRWAPHEVEAALGLAQHLSDSMLREVERTNRLATALQQTLLLEKLPDVPGLDLAVRYVPHSDDVVGGDWYDIVPLSDGRTGVVLGDVAGHGLAVSAISAQMRNALRAYLLAERDPAAALTRLNDLVTRLLPGELATAVVVVVDLATGTASVANAGHPPLVVRSPAGVADVAAAGDDGGGHGPALGLVDDAEYSVTELALEPGAAVVLFSDGLVEERRSSWEDRLARVLTGASGPVDSLDELCERLLRTVSARADDTTVLAVGRSGPAAPPEPPPEAPPVAQRVRVERVHHGDVVVDDHEWLRGGERGAQDPAVRALVDAENAWAAASTAHLGPLRERLFAETRDRTQESDLSVPSRDGAWWYYRRTVAGQQYPLLCRVPASVTVPDGAATTPHPPLRDDQGSWDPPALPDDGSALPGEQVMLDGNAEAGDSAFFALGAATTSPDGQLLAWSLDTTGDERFTLRVRDLVTGADLDVAVPGLGHGATWAGDSRTLLYTVVDDAWRPHEVRRHVVGESAPDGAGDTVVLREDDERYWLGVGRTRSGRFLVVSSGSKNTSECWLLDAGAADVPPGTAPVSVAGRREGVEYSVEHAVVPHDVLLVLHDDDAPDFALAALDADAVLSGDPSRHDPATAHRRWRTLLAHEPGRRLEDVDPFAGYVAVSWRRDALPRVAVLRVDPTSPTGLGAPEELGAPTALASTAVGSTPSFTSPLLRVNQTSFTTPPRVVDVDVATGEQHLRRQTPVRGGYDASGYVEERTWATAPDGVRVPVSVVRRADVRRDGTAPGYLYGYGSYEVSLDPWFSVSRLSLLDRGVVFAVAHVRGGGELGRRWYEDGRLARKRHTFTDFVAAAEHLGSDGWVDPKRLVASGGSAGGLLVGAALNLAPHLFAGVVAAVPFVDPLTTMLDESLPLTVPEQEEWGDPIRDPAAYALIKGYSPTENLPPAAALPRVLATTSLHDTRVLYVEPLKWVSRMRAQDDDGAPQVLLKTEVDGGHGGRSGRYEAWRERAWEDAWALDVLGLA